MSRRTMYSEEIRQFVISNGKGRNSAELTAMVNVAFASDYTLSQITALRYRLGVPSGIDTRFKAGSDAGAAYRFRCGQVPYTKGRKWDEYMPEESREKCRTGWFRKEQKPHNWMPVGSEVVKGDGYLWRKIAEPNMWRQVHILEWEKAHGPIPKGMCLTFLDGNRQNLALDNLMLISRRENRVMNMNWNNDRTHDGQITKANIAIRRIDEKVRKAAGKEE